MKIILERLNNLLIELKKNVYFAVVFEVFKIFFHTVKGTFFFVHDWVISNIYYLFNFTVGRAIQELINFLERVEQHIEEDPILQERLKVAQSKFWFWLDYIFFYNFFASFLVISICGGLIFGWKIYTDLVVDTRIFLFYIYTSQPFNFFDYWRIVVFWLFFFFTGISKALGWRLDIRVVAFNFSLFFFAAVIFLIANYSSSLTFVIPLNSVEAVGVIANVAPYKWNIFAFGYDGLSLSFLLLTTFIFPLVILTAWDRICIQVTFFYFNIIIIEMLVIGAFLALDLFMFFILFELIFVPMGLIIFIWGGRQRKIKATNYLIMYGVFSSIFFLIGILWVQNIFETTNLFYIMDNLNKMNFRQSKALWILFFIPFAVKIPMFPFHIWLPEAHVEAPTSGSIILASVLLKLGGYGILRFLFTIFRDASVFFAPFVSLLALIGMVYAALIAFRQTDFKKVIAYSSITHMNLAVLGLFTFNMNAVYGSIMLMLGHGIVSGALFFLVGVLYDRHHTRTIAYYGGLVQVMPIFSSFFFFFAIANFGFPCSLSFLGEFIVFLGLYDKLGIFICVIVGFCSLLGTYLNIQLFTSLCYGTSNSEMGDFYQDLTPKELTILITLTVCSLSTLFLHAPLSSLISQSSAIYIHLFI